MCCLPWSRGPAPLLPASKQGFKHDALLPRRPALRLASGGAPRLDRACAVLFASNVARAAAMAGDEGGRGQAERRCVCDQFADECGAPVSI